MTDPSSATLPARRHLALWFPLLPADRLARARRSGCQESDQDIPTAFIEKQHGAWRIVALDPAALALGLAVGLPLADARARVPELAAIEHDPQADAALIERIADGCERYTPLVALDPLDGITLDITGCAHLFGGEDALAADAETRLQRMGMHVRTALGHTPEAAQALARFQSVPAASEAAAIRRLPIAALRLDPAADLALRRAGLRTIGDLADRPTAPLAARFGAEAVDALHRLTGRADSRIDPRRAAPALVFECRFAEPIGHIDGALAALRDLATDAAEAMAARNRGGRRFVARLYRSDGEVRELHIETGLPSRDVTALMKLFAERIDTLADPIDPGFGFDMVRLSVPAVEPLAPTQLKLEGGAVNDDALARLVDRLSTRIGRGRVRRLLPRDSHLPEQGMLALPALDVATPAPWTPPTPGEPPLRPLHLFDPPQRIEVTAAGVPDGPPHAFRWRRSAHEIMRYEGPERIAPEWWHASPGGNLTRDYYRVEDARGRRFWIFRNGLYGEERANPGWYVHGLFA